MTELTVGACVGMKGSRIIASLGELQTENIDVINYTDNMEFTYSMGPKPPLKL
jgi:N utilization substance protein A